MKAFLCCSSAHCSCHLWIFTRLTTPTNMTCCGLGWRTLVLICWLPSAFCTWVASFPGAGKTFSCFSTAALKDECTLQTDQLWTLEWTACKGPAATQALLERSLRRNASGGPHDEVYAVGLPSLPDIVWCSPGLCMWYSRPAENAPKASV